MLYCICKNVSEKFVKDKIDTDNLKILFLFFSITVGALHFNRCYCLILLVYMHKDLLFSVCTCMTTRYIWLSSNYTLLLHTVVNTRPVFLRELSTCSSNDKIWSSISFWEWFFEWINLKRLYSILRICVLANICFCTLKWFEYEALNFKLKPYINSAIFENLVPIDLPEKMLQVVQFATFGIFLNANFDEMVYDIIHYRKILFTKLFLNRDAMNVCINCSDNYCSIDDE